MNLPLYPSQLRMWQQEQDRPGRRDCLVAALARLTGRVDADALDDALTTVVDRHEALRTGFSAPDGEPRGFVVPTPVSLLRVVDLRNRQLSSAQITTLASEDSSAPFDLAAPPLIRAVLWQRSDEDAVLSMTMHHIATDGWSTGIVVRELAELYSAGVRGRPPVLHSPVPRYADFVADRQAWLRGAEAAAQLSAWLTELAGHRALAIPAGPAAGTAGAPGDAVLTGFGAELSDRIRHFARTSRTTSFVFLLAVAYGLLAGLTGEPDITLGSAMANRTRRADEHTVGFLTNLVLLRAHVHRARPFTELLASAGDRVLGAYERQAVPIEHILERAGNISPKVLFCADNAAGVPWDFAGLTATPLDRGWIAPKRPLSLFVHEAAGQFQVRLVYRTDVLDRGTATALGAAYRDLAGGAVDRPGASVGELLDAVRLPSVQPPP
ncbi:condensation domain-containing protein [Amycolatopsis magusensis]|uniref:condensation domain-containing protein n=1 Tax=Amycolatopsis magusensis TaxID=882444 RepID=UPI003C2EEA9E